ncbi:uncharacterized protein LOC124132630 [Haliotis rufescens]|uniref:uncharacterized protein LOC124132630 n=1 Tax=Haliotis rufescens TaxID=6454 RepID=UPI00201EB308|nr:uncharacterized protein LOC124132630 [Haliotis rufescens]
MLLLLVTLSCLAAVKTQVEPCCMETQWSATRYDVHVYDDGTDVAADFYYDFTKRSTATQYYQTGSRVKANRVVTSDVKNAQYDIYPDGRCIKNIQKEFVLPNCIPKNSMHLGTSYVGEEASWLKSDTWVYTSGSANVTVGVTNPECILIFQGIVKKYHVRYMIEVLDKQVYFNGYEKGITDPTVFDVPLSCQ